MEDITVLVVQTLSDRLEDRELPIYTENMDDGGFSEPSFFLSRSNLMVTPQLFGIRLHAYRFNLDYFPRIDNPKQDMDEMAEWLVSQLQWIDLDRGMESQAKKYAKVQEMELTASEDNILHCTFRLKIRVDDVERAPFFTADQLNYTGGFKDATKESK